MVPILITTDTQLTKRLAALAVAVMVLGAILPATVASAAATVSVADKGANGADLVDDTAAFQAAINAAAGGGVVTIPAGTYIVAQVRITSAMTIQGAGRDSVIIRRAPGHTAGTVVVANTKNVVITGLTLDGDLETPLNGSAQSLQYDLATDCQVTNARVINGGGISVYNHSDRVTVTDCDFNHNENDVVFHSSAYGLVQGCTSEGSLNEAFTSYEQAGGSGGAHDNQFIGNTMRNGWAGIALQRAYNNVVRDNVIENAQWGIAVYGYGQTGDYSRDNVVENNTLVGGANNKSWGLLVEAPSHDNTIRNNVVTGWTFEPVLISGTNTTFTNNTISGAIDAVSLETGSITFSDNTVTGSKGNGVRLSVALTGIRFERNTIEKSAGEGILALDTVTKSVFAGNRIADNGTGDGSYGIYTLKPWTDVAFVDNTIADAQGTQTKAVYFRTGSEIAVTGNAVAGSTQWTNATAGTKVELGSLSYGEITGWTCTAAGTPGVWVGIGSAVLDQKTSVTVRTSASKTVRRRAVTLTAALSGGQVGDACTIEVKTPGSARWRRVATRTVTKLDASGAGSLSYRYTPLVKGTHYLRVRFAGDDGRTGSVSGNVALSVR